MLQKLAEGLLMLVAVAVVARWLVGVIGPLLVPLLMLLFVGSIVAYVLRRR
jgi:integral membrane sensor domain MASE1